jgi:hypothetical protein
MRGLASSRQPCSGCGSGWAHSGSLAAAPPAPPSPPAALLEATSAARNLRQSLSRPATGSVSGMLLPLAPCSSSPDAAQRQRDAAARRQALPGPTCGEGRGFTGHFTRASA